MRIANNKWIKIRVYIAAGFFSLFFCIILLRAFQLQILERDKLLALAEKRYSGELTFRSQRGILFDRNGNDLAISIQVPSIYANPKKINDKRKAVNLLADVLEINKRDVERKMRSNRFFVWIKRKVTPEEIEKVKKLKIHGINFVKEERRYYPCLETASHVIGFTNQDNKGLEGIELRYNNYLESKKTRFNRIRDAHGRNLVYDSPIAENKDPYNIILTLDKEISYKAQRSLKNAVEKSGAESGICIVTRPQTGEVLAMAVVPEFNPNVFWRYKPNKWRNRTVTDCFEPGSSLKAFLVAAALEEGVIKQGSVFDCENGLYNVGKHIIHDTHPFGKLRADEIIKFSSNIGAIKIGQRLGPERYREYLKKFGFGEYSGIDLPGERKGVLKPIRNTSIIGQHNLCFGQGLSVSPIQLIMAFGAIANGGHLMKPYLVKAIVDQKGKTVKKFYPKVRRDVVSADTAKKMRIILEGVVQKGGTATRAAINGYSVAGKTGTAQKVDPVEKIYSEDKFVAIFGGFAPSDYPAIAILVILNEPKGKPYGGVVSAPVFKDVGYWTLNYLNIHPSTDYNEIKRSENTDNNPKMLLQVKREINAFNSDKLSIMPVLTGFSVRDVLVKTKKLKLEITVKGSGLAVEQSIAPGTPLREGMNITVIFRPPCS